MKIKTVQLVYTLSLAVLFWPFIVAAQTSVNTTTLSNCQTQIVTLASQSANGTPVTYNFNSNQIVSISGIAESVCWISYTLNNGITFSNELNPNTVLPNSLYFTGLSKITISPQVSDGYTWTAFVTLTVLTPSSANVVSNYVPADAIVIPASATGNVQIILESSPDLVNWTAASPGTYGASAGTNRFFRVRAVSN
jgi:hypothetical protein